MDVCIWALMEMQSTCLDCKGQDESSNKICLRSVTLVRLSLLPLKRKDRECSRDFGQLFSSCHHFKMKRNEGVIFLRRRKLFHRTECLVMKK